MKPYQLSAKEAIEQICQGNLTTTQLIESCLERIRELEPVLKAWEFIDVELPMQHAKRIDRSRELGEVTGVLQGVPIGVKDIFNTKEGLTQMGSPYWKGFTAGNDARVVETLKSRGGILMGKTVTAEFAVHHPGPTVNPYHASHSPGTSSSGSAVAVATGMVPLAIGTQTAGSTIRPASYCGVYGYKPSFGVVPRTGILKTIDTLDHVTFFARTPGDIKLVFDLARVRGANHPFVHKYLDQHQQDATRKQWKVAFVKGPRWSDAETYAQAALEEFAAKLDNHNSIVVEELALPTIFEQVHEIHQKIYCKMLSYYFSEELEERPDLISNTFKAMTDFGRQVTREEYFSGLEFQKDLQARTEELFDDFDIILNLSTGGEAMVGLESPDRPDNCLIWTFAHVPALSVPALSGPSGLPFGAQLVANKYADYDLIDFAQHLLDEQLINRAPFPVLPGMKAE